MIIDIVLVHLGRGACVFLFEITEQQGHVSMDSFCWCSNYEHLMGGRELVKTCWCSQMNELHSEEYLELPMA